VIYWMSRDQRVQDNHALSQAAAMAQESRSELLVAFCLTSEFLGAGREQFAFLLQGLRSVGQRLQGAGIPFHFLQGGPGVQVARLAVEVRAAAVVCDFDPLRIKAEWRSDLLAGCECAVLEVDAHNIVPCWWASPKKEWAAATFRPKLKALLPSFIDEMPGEIAAVDGRGISDAATGWEDRLDRAAGVRPSFRFPTPGEGAARKALSSFLRHRLDGYAAARNDPNLDGQSGLSPYLHFGQISAQWVALEVMAMDAPAADKGAFLEELTVRRELSDNFCHYEVNYDSPQCFPAWSKASLGEHESDRRDYLYSLPELEQARTHDPLWNAAQRQMTATGRMHGYLRMYWAKKILEWSTTAEEAQRAAILLNDRYELDGRDPNGYAGLAWCIGGVHDRAWPSRPIFGKVRYMSLGGARSKFDVERFIAQYPD
jgi:deoxyribodipyrimidine photo-lyase